MPVGGGRAWPDNESTRRAKLAARTARGRAAAHGAARPNKSDDPAIGGLTTRVAIEKCVGFTVRETVEQCRKTPAQTPGFATSQQYSQKSYEKYASFIGSS